VTISCQSYVGDTIQLHGQEKSPTRFVVDVQALQWMSTDASNCLKLVNSWGLWKHQQWINCRGGSRSWESNYCWQGKKLRFEFASELLWWPLFKLLSPVFTLVFWHSSLVFTGHWGGQWGWTWAIRALKIEMANSLASKTSDFSRIMMGSWCENVSKFKAIIGSSDHIHNVPRIIAPSGYQMICICRAVWIFLITFQIYNFCVLN